MARSPQSETEPSAPGSPVPDPQTPEAPLPPPQEPTPAEDAPAEDTSGRPPADQVAQESAANANERVIETDAQEKE